ncbi:uncharacterized protein LOC111008161 [Momordica charantia]|uniref:Uncharacterized protein LOC111008161 n=1 Tax=Momordica charantia TaxID=3673 RepID=A0A6J1C7L1_MOMCH|nr:uncharacterized protein LOC111008161 [Momordica charantia]
MECQCRCHCQCRRRTTTTSSRLLTFSEKGSRRCRRPLILVPDKLNHFSRNIWTTIERGSKQAFWIRPRGQEFQRGFAVNGNVLIAVSTWLDKMAKPMQVLAEKKKLQRYIAALLKVFGWMAVGSNNIGVFPGFFWLTHSLTN